MFKQYAGLGIVGIFIAATIGLGFYLVGSPGESRAIQFDRIRSQDVSSINRAVDDYYRDKKILPSDLNELSLAKQPFGNVTYLKNIPKDPKTNKEYSYRVLTTNTYEICAEFDTSSEDIAKRKTGFPDIPDYTYDYYKSEKHGKGEQCFSYDVPIVNSYSAPSPLPLFYNPTPLPEATGSAIVNY